MTILWEDEFNSMFPEGHFPVANDGVTFTCQCGWRGFRLEQHLTEVEKRMENPGGLIARTLFEKTEASKVFWEKQDSGFTTKPGRYRFVLSAPRNATLFGEPPLAAGLYAGESVGLTYVCSGGIVEDLYKLVNEAYLLKQVSKTKLVLEEILTELTSA